MTDSIVDKVRSLYEMMKDENIRELEINSKECKIFIKRRNPEEGGAVIQRNSVAPQKSIASGISQKKSEISVDMIKSPIMGVFYKSPSPSSAAFVNEGDVVEAGKTICIIEAMKVMNEIKAAFKAKILKILVENGKPVNADQDLFEVERV
jgi:acetyl-CoA carboxylase biotin carboxyl carrier protein